MLLAIDIGNSRIKLGVFDGPTLYTKLAFPTEIIRAGAEIETSAMSLAGLSVKWAMACSVVPEVEPAVAAFVDRQFGVRLQFVDADSDTGLKLRYDPPNSIGSDRVVNAFAATERYGRPCIICSFGTATTIDVVDEAGEMLGGLIAPGMRTAASALHAAGAKLPEVEIERPNSIIGTSTANAIKSGLFYSQVGLIETAVRRIRDELGEYKVVATGGFAPVVAMDTPVIDVWDEDLTLTGLRMLHERINPRT